MANNELNQLLSKYKHTDYTSREINNVIQHYRSLTYRLEAFVFNNGSRKDLINLYGTIPVGYKGVVYNIPICIWIMDTHPQHSPLCFVKPTPEMSIKVSKYVDSNGKVFLPYLHEWNSGSTVLALIMHMKTAFAELPPVYSKPRDDIPYPPNFPNKIPSVPYPPYPSPPYPIFPGPMNGTPYPPASNTTPYPNPGVMQDNIGGTITEEHIKASLLSAVEDKLRRRLREQAQQSQAELETLKRTQQELAEGKSRLEDVLARLQREKAELDKNVSILHEKEKELETAVERLGEQEGVDVDEAVITTAPLYSQLLNSFAEEATLEDVIYYMGEALRKEVIDLDTFLKQVRTLARRQFTLRALMHKCRQKAQLAC